MVGLKKRGRATAYVVLELVAVAAVIALLLAMGFMLYRSMRLAARVSVAESNLKQVATGLELYFRRYCSYPPQGCELAEELAAFVDNPAVFDNPLLDEGAPGETISLLYRAPNLDEIDRPNHYLTAMIGEDGKTAVILWTGHRTQRRHDLVFDPNGPAADLLAALDPDGGEEEQGQEISGCINLNPRNNADFEFHLVKPHAEPDGKKVITRDDLLASNGDYSYSGPATEVFVCPKGNGNQNTLYLIVEGEPRPYLVRNGTCYTITSRAMTVQLYNDKAGANGKAMGRWWIHIEAKDATITPGR